jgi:GNAT superfamily N-acetyltransferase
VVLDGQIVVAHYASASAAVVREAAPKAMRRNQPGILPAVLLSRLAVHSDYQGQGLAAALLKHFMMKAFEVSERVGVRVVLVHAKEDGVKAFYEKYGFVHHPSTLSRSFTCCHTVHLVLLPIVRGAQLVFRDRLT